jgi:hypothetical protein
VQRFPGEHEYTEGQPDGSASLRRELFRRRENTSPRLGRRVLRLNPDCFFSAKDLSADNTFRPIVFTSASMSMTSPSSRQITQLPAQSGHRRPVQANLKNERRAAKGCKWSSELNPRAVRCRTPGLVALVRKKWKDALGLTDRRTQTLATRVRAIRFFCCPSRLFSAPAPPVLREPRDRAGREHRSRPSDRDRSCAAKATEPAPPTRDAARMGNPPGLHISASLRRTRARDTADRLRRRRRRRDAQYSDD